MRARSQYVYMNLMRNMCSQITLVNKYNLSQGPVGYVVTIFVPRVFVVGDGRVNTLRPRQDERHFADDIFKCIFLNENA